MQEVVRQISEKLVKKGHEVTVATSKCKFIRPNKINGVTIKEFSIHGNWVNGIFGDIDQYKNFLLSENFDIITCFAAQQWATDIILQILKEIKGKKVFVPTGFSALYDPKYSDYFEKMKIWLHEFDQVVFLSNSYRDINFARSIDLHNIIIIPNGASEIEFTCPKNNKIRSKYHIPENSFLILHVGSHTGLKGHKEAISIFSHANIKNAVFVLVGNKVRGGCTLQCALRSLLFNFNPLHRIRNKRIYNLHLSREEIVDLFHAADLFLFPSNVECSPIVLFESMASKTPFLTTDVGNSAEIIDWCDGGILLPTFFNKKGYSFADIKKSAILLKEIWENSEKREKLKENGYTAWKKHFTWEEIANQYEKLYQNILNSNYSSLSGDNE